MLSTNINTSTILLLLEEIISSGELIESKLDTLISSTEEYFRTEEFNMKRINFPFYSFHILSHREIIHYLYLLKIVYPIYTTKYYGWILKTLKEKLNTHIACEDSSLNAYEKQYAEQV